LNHPETIIRQTVTILIEKVGQTSPHSICYPAIVNAKHYDDILDDVKIVREKLLTDKILSNDSSAEQQSAMANV
jgi:hypothetical protein